MDRPQPTPQQKLDEMLASGAISAEDYQRLTEAMRASDTAATLSEEEEASNAPGAPTAKRLRRNWSRHQIAGVCAGFADYYALDLVTVRLIAVALAVVGLPVALVGYVVLAFVLPWDDQASAREALRASWPSRLAARLVVRSPRGHLVLTIRAKSILALFLCLFGVVLGALIALVGHYGPFYDHDAYMLGYTAFLAFQLAAIGLGFVSREERIGKLAIVTASVLTAGSLALVA